MSNELKRHKKSDRIKWIATALALLFISITIVGMCLQIFGSGKLKPSEWVKSDKQVEQIVGADNAADNADGSNQ